MSGDGAPALFQTTIGGENLKNAVTLVIQFSGPHVEKKEREENLNQESTWRAQTSASRHLEREI